MPQSQSLSSVRSLAPETISPAHIFDMGDSVEGVTYESSTSTVLILFVCLLCLIVLLIFLYKKLNKEANGEYAIRRMVYKEGGVRDRMRDAALLVGTRLGVQLWPHSNTDEDEEEMQEIQDEDGQVARRSSQESDTEGDEEEEEEEEGEEDSMEHGEGKGGEASDDSSSLESAEAGEQIRLTDEPEAKEETKAKREEKQEIVEEEQAKVEASGGPGLLIDLKQFSGSAIWSEEEGGDGQGGDVTPL